MLHDITAFGQHTRSNNVGRDMPSLPLDNTHGQMTTSVACHHPLWAAYMVELRRRGMPLSPLGSINGRTTSGVACQHHLWAAHRRTTSGVACQHCLWAAHTVERCSAWHDITSFGQRIRSNNVERGMPSPPWDITHGQTMSGVVCYHRLWAAQTVGRHRV